MKPNNILDMGTDFVFSNFDEVKQHIMYNKFSQREEVDTLIMSNTLIKTFDLTHIPYNIKNVTLSHSSLNTLSWVAQRPFGNLSFDNNEFLGGVNINGTLVCESLSFDHNKITTPRFDNFKCATVSMKHNEIKTATFFNCKIQHLDLSHNLIEYIINLPDNMITLNLSHNKLKELSQHNLSETLTHLDLSYNRLITIVKLPSSLLHLDVSYNDLTGNSYVFKILPKMLKVLKVGGNYIENPEVLFGSFEGDIDYSDMKKHEAVTRIVMSEDDSDDGQTGGGYYTGSFDDDYGGTIGDDDIRVGVDYVFGNKHGHGHGYGHSHASRDIDDPKYHEELREQLYGYNIKNKRRANFRRKYEFNQPLQAPIETIRYSNKTSIIPRWNIQL